MREAKAGEPAGGVSAPARRPTRTHPPAGTARAGASASKRRPPLQAPPTNRRPSPARTHPRRQPQPLATRAEQDIHQGAVGGIGAAQRQAASLEEMAAGELARTEGIMRAVV